MGRVLQCYLAVMSPDTILTALPVAQLRQESVDLLVTAWRGSTDSIFQEDDPVEEAKRRAALWRMEMALRVCLQNSRCEHSPPPSSAPSAGGSRRDSGPASPLHNGLDAFSSLELFESSSPAQLL